MESSSLSDCSPSLTDLLKPSEGESDGDTAPSWQYGQRPLIDSTNRCTEPWGCTPKDGPNVTDTLTAAEALARVKRDCEVPDSAYEIIPVPGFFGMRLREAGQMSDFWNEDGTVARATLGMTHASVEEHNQALEELRSTADALGFDVLTVEYIRHAETAHNIAVFPELDGNGLEQYPLVYHDTELTTPENRSLLLGKPDLPDLPIDGLSQSQRLGAARYRLARQGLKLPQAMFISSLVRTGQTIQAVNDVCSSLASKDAPPSDRYDEDACPDHFLPFVLENNRELSHGSISDKRRTMTEFREKFPHAILGPGCTENDEFFLGLDTCQRMGIYDYEQRLAAGELEDPEVAKLYAPDSAEVTEGRRDILHKYGLHQLDGVKQQANARYLREDPRSVLRRSRLADEIMFDTMRSLRVHECLLGTHGLSSAVKLQDWWCNATLQKETRDAFGDKFASLFEAYGEDGKLPGTPAKMWRAEDRPMVLLVRRRDGKPVDPTMADAYKATVRSLVPRRLTVGSLQPVKRDFAPGTNFASPTKNEQVLQRFMSHTSLQGRDRIRVSNLHHFGPDDFRIRGHEIPPWVCCETGELFSGDRTSPFAPTKMLVMLDTDRTTLDFCRDTYAIQPAIMNGHLIARTVCIPHSECVRRRPTPDGSFLSTELFVDAARCARQLSTALGCQIAAKSDPEDTPPPYTHTQSKFTAEEPSSAADVSQDNSKAEQNLLRLFSTLLTKRVSERLPKDYSSHTRDQDPVVIILGEKDFERCLEGCTDPKAKAKELQHIPEANDRFGGDDLVWIDGEPGRYGNTGRLLVSVQFDSKYCWAEPDVKMSLAIPTEVNNLTGVPAGVMDLLDTSTALGSAARQQINTALDEFARYWRDPEASMMFQETVGEIQSYRDQNLRSVSQDKAPDVRRLMAAGFVSARVTRLMQSKFGENNYPITSLLLRGTHAKILEDRRCPARELPLSPEDWKLNELIDEKYLVATPASNDGHDETPSVANQSSLSYKVKTWCSKVLGGKSSRD